MQTTQDRFDFKFSLETRPFHVFQAFAQYRKAKFRHWNVNRWCEELGLDCKTTLMNIMQGKALPEDELVEKILNSMQVNDQVKAEMRRLINVYRQKAAKRSPVLRARTA